MDDVQRLCRVCLEIIKRVFRGYTEHIRAEGIHSVLRGCGEGVWRMYRLYGGYLEGIQRVYRWCAESIQGLFRGFA